MLGKFDGKFKARLSTLSMHEVGELVSEADTEDGIKNIFLYMYGYINIHVFICTNIDTNIHKCAYIYVHLYVSTLSMHELGRPVSEPDTDDGINKICIYIYPHMYVYPYGYRYMCLYIYIYIYIYA
jgi:hypothetical protein